MTGYGDRLGDRKTIVQGGGNLLGQEWPELRQQIGSLAERLLSATGREETQLAEQLSELSIRCGLGPSVEVGSSNDRSYSVNFLRSDGITMKFGGLSQEDAAAEIDESFILSDTDDSDGPVQQVHTPGATIDQKSDYYRQAKRTPLLTAEQEVELAKKIEAGLFAEEAMQKGMYGGEPIDDSLREELMQIAENGRRAKKRFIESNLRLVINRIVFYEGRGLDGMDLIQEGNLGLIRAVEKWDYTKGAKFSTYAVWWIRQAVTRAIADQSRTIRLPVNVNDAVSSLNKFREEEGHEPTPEELANVFDMTPERYAELRTYADVELVPAHTLTEDDAARVSINEEQEPEDIAIANSLRDQISVALGTLWEREADVLSMRFGLTDGRPKSLDEIGKVFGVTRERIRQIESRAMKKLRENPILARLLRDYLD